MASQIPGEGEIRVPESLDDQIANICEQLFKRSHFLAAQANGIENPEEGEIFRKGNSPREICISKFGAVVIASIERNIIELDRANGYAVIKGGIYFKIFQPRRHVENTPLSLSHGFPISRVLDLSWDRNTTSELITEPLTNEQLEEARIDLNRGIYSSYILPWEHDGEKEGALESLTNLQKLLS